MADVASVPQLLPQLPSTSTSSSELNLNVTAEIPAPPENPESSLSLNDKSDEPESKRFKKFEHPPNGAIGSSKKLERLEMRLGSVLSCVVCLDLPKAATYQCVMGHLMCAGCLQILLADGRLRDQVATCPNCRVEISKNNTSRNLAVEKAVSELPSECQFCGQEFPRISLDHHEQVDCEERPTECKYSIIGCHWKGPIHEAKEHENACAHPKKSGAEVITALKDRDAKYAEEKKLFSTLIDLLSYEKIIFNEKETSKSSDNLDNNVARQPRDRKKRKHDESNPVASTVKPINECSCFPILDLQLKPYRTDDFIVSLYHESSRFSAFNAQWVVKSIINNSQRDPHQFSEREITYQLILKTKTSVPLSIHFFVLQGPFSDMKVNTNIYKHDFTDAQNESPFNYLPLPDTTEVNRLLALKTINFRLIMFLASK